MTTLNKKNTELKIIKKYTENFKPSKNNQFLSYQKNYLISFNFSN